MADSVIAIDVPRDFFPKLRTSNQHVCHNRHSELSQLTLSLSLDKRDDNNTKTDRYLRPRHRNNFRLGP